MYNSLQFLFLLSFSIIITVNGEEPMFAEDEYGDSHGKIIHSSAFFRHGDRAPYIQYPSDPFREQSYWDQYWPQGKANLSETGKMQTNNVGKWFRKRYDSLLKEENVKNFLKMDSSDADRTIASAKCFLHGFFFPSEDEKCTVEVLKREPPVEIKYNQMISFLVDCKKYKSEWRSANDTSELQNFYADNQKTFDGAAYKIEVQFSPTKIVEAIKEIYFLHNTLFIEKLYGLELPPWTNEIYPDALKPIVKRHLPNKVRTPTMKRLRVGPLIGEMIQDMESRIESESHTTTFHFYFGHETTIASLLDTFFASLAVLYDIAPPYAAIFLIELRKKNDDYVVTILYRDEPTSKPQLLQVPGCGFLCTFKEFKKLFENLIPKNWEDECNEE